MHTLDCLVAVGGDIGNKVPRQGVTVPEMMLLQYVHGPGAVTDIVITGNPRIQQLEERERLLRAYPKYESQVIGFWRDNGGEFVKDVRQLKLSPALFARDRTAPYDGADEIEREELAAIEKAEAPKKRKRKAKAPVDPDPEMMELDPPPGVEFTNPEGEESFV